MPVDLSLRRVLTAVEMTVREGRGMKTAHKLWSTRALIFFLSPQTHFCPQPPILLNTLSSSNFPPLPLPPSLSLFSLPCSSSPISLGLQILPNLVLPWSLHIFSSCGLLQDLPLSLFSFLLIFRSQMSSSQKRLLLPTHLTWVYPHHSA